jgi:hypothetical protein
MTPAELLASKDRANLRRRLRRLWASDCLFSELCDEMGMTGDEVRLYAAAMGLGPDRPEPDVYLPTPEQIRIETAKIRAAWTPEEREARLGGRPYAILNPTGDDTDAGGSAPRDYDEGGESDDPAW